MNYLTTVHRFLNDAAERGRIGRPSDECRLKLVILAGRRVGNVHNGSNMDFIGGEVTWAAAIQAAAAVIGFGVVIYQVAHLRKNIRGATQDRLYGHYTELCKLFMQHPHLYPYFYEEETFADDPKFPHLREEIELISETMLGLMEHSCLQHKNLPHDSWEGCWRPYTYERFDKSPLLVKYFLANQRWYTKEFCSVVNAFLKSRQWTAKHGAQRGVADESRRAAA